MGSAREKTLGAVCSVVVGIISSAFFIGSQALGVPLEAGFATSSVIGNFLGYTADILFAKRCFHETGPDGPELVAYDQWDLQRRFAWYLRSLVSRSFIRFVVTVVIDVIVCLAIIDLVSTSMDDLGIRFRMRDTVVATVVTMITFHSFINEMRFRYAYSAEDDITHDLIVYAWATILLVLYAMLRRKRQTKQETPPPAAAALT